MSQHMSVAEIAVVPSIIQIEFRKSSCEIQERIQEFWRKN